MRRLAVVAGAVLLAGCVPTVAPVAPAPGPTLVLDVTNESSRDVVVGYAFEAVGTSGTGESLFAPCRREAVQVSTVSGVYRVVVGGEMRFEGTVPQRASAETFLVVPVRIGADGAVEVTAPGVALAPLDQSAAIPCG